MPWLAWPSLRSYRCVPVPPLPPAQEEGGRRAPMPARAARANNQLRRQRRVMQARKQNS